MRESVHSLKSEVEYVYTPIICILKFTVYTDEVFQDLQSSEVKQYFLCYKLVTDNECIGK